MINLKIFTNVRISCIVLALILSACKTQKKVTVEPVPQVAAQSTVFFFTESGLSLLKEAVDTAHANQQKIFMVIRLPEKTDQDTSISHDYQMSNLKKQVRQLVTNYNIDGLGIYVSDHAREMIEYLSVETMLLKPYLVNFVIWSEEKEHKIAKKYLDEGIIDLMVPENKIERKTSAFHKGQTILQPNLKKIQPQQVIRLDMSLFLQGIPGGRKIYIGKNKKNLITDSEGCIHFISEKADTLDLVMDSVSLRLATSDWQVPYSYSVGVDGKTFRKSPWVEFRRMPEGNTNIEEYDLLYKTDYLSQVWIDGTSVKQYKTGIFFKKVKFAEGANRIRATVMNKDSQTVCYEQEFIYTKSEKARNVFPLWIDKKSVEPASDMELLSDDRVRVSFQGSRGQEGYLKIMPGKKRLKCSREDFEDYSVYRADLYLNQLTVDKVYHLAAEILTSQGSEKIHLDLQNTLKIKGIEEYPLVKVKNEHSRLTYNLAAPRLGGPIRAELSPGVMLKTSGRIGDYYRIRLSSIESGFIHKDDVVLMPAESVVPSYHITTMSCGPATDADLLTIPYPENVPYEIFADPDQKRIVLTLYGVQTASTWVTHLNNRKIIDRITWLQTTPETYQIFINLRSSTIWGYDLLQDGKRLILKVKYPPVYDITSIRPLTGVKIAIEAGHGGSNTGAIGLSGLPEKEINLDLSFRLGELCKSMGADVLQVRDADVDMSLLAKRDKAVKWDPDILVSIHANAGGRGYLSVAGTSTYWHNPFWAPLAAKIYDRLLELDLKEFGVVGSFNYTVTRTSQIPSVLVEQAFMSHAEDEEKLADPEFRQQMAQKIQAGLIDYLKASK